MNAMDYNATDVFVHNLEDDLTPGSVRGDGHGRRAPALGLAMGDILVGSGRLSLEDVERVVQQQQKNQLPFGETAVALRLISVADVDFALNKQFDYDCLDGEGAHVSPEVVAAFQPFSAVGENLRAVRSQLMLRWYPQDVACKLLTVVSPDRSEGRTFIAANLAVVFAQQGERTLLIDGNLRQPRQAELFFKNRRVTGLTHLLASRAGLEVIDAVPGMPNLSVLCAGALPPNPQELLGRPTLGHLLDSVSRSFDVVLIDTPASNDYADAEIISARAGAALVLTRKHRTTLPAVRRMANRLQDNGVALVGTVLNTP